MSIDKITAGLKSFSEITSIQQAPKSEGVAGQNKFGDVLSSAMKEVDTLQKTADAQVEGLVLGKDGVTTHGAMLALEKADVAFQLMNTIRSKIIRAYEEVLRTQI
jgi:flagellar hook-basal body complex protein FliE